MPPLTPRRMRAMRGLGLGAPSRRAPLAPVAILDLAARDLLEGDGQVVLGAGVDHRGRELLEGALAEVVVVAVDLPRALGGDDHAGVRRVDVLQKAVYARRDHVSDSRAPRERSVR